MRYRSHLISGAISAALLFALAGCRFPYSFAGGGLDAKLRTVAVLPFDNKTTTSGIERELSELLSSDMRRLGLREAPEARAHVIVSGTIQRYEVDIPVAFSADPSRAAGTRRRLEMSVDILFSNSATGAILFEKKGMPTTGEYAESAEGVGRREALVKLVNEIIRGVQSQW